MDPLSETRLVLWVSASARSDQLVLHTSLHTLRPSRLTQQNMFALFILALMYNGINGAISRARGEYDPINSVAAGAMTGALFKSTGKKGDLFFFGSWEPFAPFPTPQDADCFLLSFDYYSRSACCWISRRRLRRFGRYLGVRQGGCPVNEAKQNREAKEYGQKTNSQA